MVQPESQNIMTARDANAPLVPKMICFYSINILYFEITYSIKVIFYFVATLSLCIYFFFFLNDAPPPKFSPLPLHAPLPFLIRARRTLPGPLMGVIPKTQEMLAFCGHHNFTADVEVIPIQKVNEAYERLLKSDVKYRFS